MRTKTIIVVLIQQVFLSQYPQAEHVLSDFLPQHQRLQDKLVLRCVKRKKCVRERLVGHFVCWVRRSICMLYARLLGLFKRVRLGTCVRRSH